MVILPLLNQRTVSTAAPQARTQRCTSEDCRAQTDVSQEQDGRTVKATGATSRKHLCACTYGGS